MIVFQTDDDGVFIGEVECQPSPLEPGVFLIPRNAIEIAPPELTDNEQAIWDGEKWVVEIIVENSYQPDDEIIEPISNSEIRRRAYVKLADPLFFKWQRGEGTKEEWLSQIDEVKKLYPLTDS